MPDNLEAIFEQLKTVLQQFESELNIKVETAGKYYLLSKKLDEKKRQIWFGGVEIKKNYVSFHLIPVYIFPELLKDISPELKKRLTGKSCFNFKKSDNALFADLENLTKAGFETFKQKEMI